MSQGWHTVCYKKKTCKLGTAKITHKLRWSKITKTVGKFIYKNSETLVSFVTPESMTLSLITDTKLCYVEPEQKLKLVLAEERWWNMKLWSQYE